MHISTAGRTRRPLSLRTTALLLSIAAGLAATASAVETKFWLEDERADFERGNLHNLSLRSDGRLYLAPEFREIFDSSTPYLWAIAADSKGNLYAGGGGSGSGAAKLFAIDAQGKSRTLAELDGLEIHAIAVDSSDRVYAATDPDGKVYRIGANGKAEVFYDPHAKYIWALAFDNSGNLFVATGDQGEIHRVTRDGKGSVFFRTEETHARSLAMDASGNLIVGTEPGGLILRVSPAGQGFVLYQTPKREVTVVAVGKNGAIYAACVGNKAAGPAISPLPSLAPTLPPPSSPGAVTITSAAGPAHSNPPAASFGAAAPPIVGGSEVYRIDTDGAPRKVWSNPDDIVYAMAFDRNGHPLLGTGNRGRIYRLDSDALWTLLLDASPTQVTGFASSARGQFYAVTGNIGKAYEIGPGMAKSGAFESDAFDASAFSYWGRLNFRGVPEGVSILTRSGNLNRPQNNWSSWAALTADRREEEGCAACGGGRIASPPARFLQYKLELNASAARGEPEVSSVEIAYLPKNVAPVLEEIEVTPPNYRFPASLLTSTPSTNITLPAIGAHRKSSAPSGLDLSSSQTMNYAKGFLGVRWAVSDEDGDALIYKVEIRGMKDSEWLPLKDKIKDKYFGWDTTEFPDGEYVVRVTASDAPDNPPDQALSTSLESDPFLIDNTPPQILDLKATPSGNRIEVHWRAHDASSTIDRAEYSVNGADWLLAAPVTRLSDSRNEEYRLALDRATASEQVIAVRVTDEYDNQTVEKVVVKR